MTTVFKTELANYGESIRNIVYATSRYIEQMKVMAPENLKLLEENNFDTDLVSFLLTEGEEILRNKMLRMTVDAVGILHLKYDSIKSKLKKDSNTQRSFIITRDYISYMYEELETIQTYDLPDLAFNNDNDLKELYSLNEFVAEELKVIEALCTTFHKEGETEEVDLETLIKEINMWEEKLHKTLIYIKNMIESTNKKRATLILFRDMVRCMLLSKGALRVVETQ